MLFSITDGREHSFQLNILETAWCSHTRGSEFISNSIWSCWRLILNHSCENTSLQTLRRRSYTSKGQRLNQSVPDIRCCNDWLTCRKWTRCVGDHVVDIIQKVAANDLISGHLLWNSIWPLYANSDTVLVPMTTHGARYGRFGRYVCKNVADQWAAMLHVHPVWHRRLGGSCWLSSYSQNFWKYSL